MLLNKKYFYRRSLLLFSLLFTCTFFSIVFAKQPDKSKPLATHKSSEEVEQTYRIELKDAPIKNVVSLMSRLSHKTYIYTEQVINNKKITVESSREYTASEALKILDAILELNGLGIIDDQSVSRIVKRQDLKFSGADVIRGKGPVQAGSMVIRAIPVNRIDVQTLRSNLSPLISRNGTILAIPTANLLLLKDTATNVDRLVKLVKIIQAQGHPFLKIHLELYPLKNGNALKISQVLQNIFRINTIALPINQKVAIYSDDRTNSLVLVGSPTILNKVKKVIKRLDVPMPQTSGNVRVFYLQNLEAEEASTILDRVLRAVNLTKKSLAIRNKALIQATVVPDKSSNALVVYADTNDFPEITKLIKSIDIQRVQIHLQALIMEVRLDKSLDLGIDWQAGGITGQSSDGTGGAAVVVGGATSTGSPRAFPATSATGAVVGVIGGPISFGDKTFSTFNAFIKAVQKDSAVNILSNPQLMTLNKEKASIKVGEKIPTLGSSKTDINGNITQNIQYREVGISLEVTPQVNDKSILLLINETSSNLVQDATGVSNTNAITTLNRVLKTKVSVKEGQTLALGGLISDEIEQVETKVPLLGDIPFLGWFFRDTSSRVRKTNLLLFITPTIVRTTDDMENVKNKVSKSYEDAKQGNFRIDITHEFKLPEGITRPQHLGEKIKKSTPKQTTIRPPSYKIKKKPSKLNGTKLSKKESSGQEISVIAPSKRTVAKTSVTNKTKTAHHVAHKKHIVRHRPVHHVARKKHTVRHRPVHHVARKKSTVRHKAA